MEELRNITNYVQYKESLDNEFRKTTEGFVKIGYLLRMARDTDILKESKYENVNEFAKGEYNLERTQVSRFIAINERFGNPDNMEELKDNYKGFGVAKLAIMLQLPEEVNEELTPEFSKADIQAIREEVAEEEKVTDIERMIEPVPENIAEVDNILGQTIIALGKEEPQLYRQIHEEAEARGKIEVESLKDDMTPNDDAVFSVRVPGKGRMFLTLKANGENSITNVRTGEKSKYTWDQIARAWKIIINPTVAAEKDWEEHYGEAFPKENIAPVQQKTKVVKAKEPKKEPKQEPKQQELHEIEKSIPVPSPAEEVKEEPIQEQPVEEVDEPIEGQDNIMDHEEWLPESENVEKTSSETAFPSENVVGKKNEEAAVEELEESMTEPVAMDKNTYETRKKAYMVGIDNNIGSAMANRDSENWELVKTDLEDAIRFVNLMIELEGMEVENGEEAG